MVFWWFFCGSLSLCCTGFAKIEPYIFNSPKADNDAHHKVPRTRQYMVKCVIQKIQQYDKSRFDMLKEVQHIQDVAKKHNMEKSIIEERSKNMMMDFASKQSKTRTQLNALESVLNRIKTSSKNVSKERITFPRLGWIAK